MEAEDAPDVERARAGDADAFGRLVERHSRVVFRLAYRMLGNEQDAEDARLWLLGHGMVDAAGRLTGSCRL